MADFAELGLSPQLVSSLTALGFEEPTPIQEAAIPAILAGSDVLGQAEYELCSTKDQVNSDPRHWHR